MNREESEKLRVKREKQEKAGFYLSLLTFGF
jgi:hypothetical protein